MSTLTVGELQVTGVETGAIYVLRSTIGPDRQGDRRHLLHVISRFSGGEIRGFYREVSSAGHWIQRTPDYIGSWPEIDQALANLLGEPVRDSKGVEYSPNRFRVSDESCAAPASETVGRSAPVDGERQPFLPGVAL